MKIDDDYTMTPQFCYISTRRIIRILSKGLSERAETIVAPRRAATGDIKTLICIGAPAADPVFIQCYPAA
ncbi:unnamed protein product, partial [Iphiclides podalirius]